MGQKYHDEEWLRREYVDKRRSTPDIGEECGVTATTISDWLTRHGIKTRSQSEAQRSQGKHTNKEWLREQYIENERSMADIGGECGVTAATVLKYLRKYSIPTRHSAYWKRQENLTIVDEKGEFGGIPGPYMKVMNSWIADGKREYRSVYVHQLLAIAEGADPHKVFSGGEYHVHHKNGIKWDNRPENLEFTEREEHLSHHNANRQRTETGEWL